MSGQVPEAAVEAPDLSEAYNAGAIAIAYNHGRVSTVDRDRVVAGAVIDHAYPHIRRAVIEELIAKAEGKAQRSLERERIENEIARDWLRAEMEGDDRG